MRAKKIAAFPFFKAFSNSFFLLLFSTFFGAFYKLNSGKNMSFYFFVVPKKHKKKKTELGREKGEKYR